MLLLHPLEPFLLPLRPLSVGVILHGWRPFLIESSLWWFVVDIVKLLLVCSAPGIVPLGVLLLTLLGLVASVALVASASAALSIIL